MSRIKFLVFKYCWTFSFYVEIQNVVYFEFQRNSKYAHKYENINEQH